MLIPPSLVLPPLDTRCLVIKVSRVSRFDYSFSRQSPKLYNLRLNARRVYSPSHVSIFRVLAHMCSTIYAITPGDRS